MLSRFDDKAIDNAKIEQAADILDGVEQGGKPGRRFGYTRAYGAWSWSVTYANAHLTDGLLTRRAIEKYRIGKAECEALVTVGAWVLEDGGYRIHDFLDWNPSAADVKSKQSKDRDRKRKAAGYDGDSARNPSGVAADSTRSRIGQDRTGRAGPGQESLEGEPERERALALVHPPLDLSPGQLQASALGLFGAWNNLCALDDSPFHTVTVRSHPKATQALRAHPDIDWWAELFTRVGASDFLRRDAKMAPADLWWVLDHADEIAAGRYDNRAPQAIADPNAASVAAAKLAIRRLMP